MGNQENGRGKRLGFIHGEMIQWHQTEFITYHVLYILEFFDFIHFICI